MGDRDNPEAQGNQRAYGEKYFKKMGHQVRCPENSNALSGTREGEKMRVAYPALIEKYEEMYLVYVPDLETYTQGESLEDAIVMAREAISMKCITEEDNGISLPRASSYQMAVEKAKTAANGEGFDYTGGICTLIDSDLAAYRKAHERRMVRRNVTLPSWMNSEAERRGINVSRVLQDALNEMIEA